jgi:hypothetical protein
MNTTTKGAEAFTKYCEGCPNRIAPDVERRPGNALNVEIGTPVPRCKLRAPARHKGMEVRWLLSGGSPLIFGACNRSACPLQPNHCEDCGHRKESHMKAIGGRCIVGGGFDNCGCDGHVSR